MLRVVSSGKEGPSRVSWPASILIQNAHVMPGGARGSEQLRLSSEGQAGSIGSTAELVFNDEQLHALQARAATACCTGGVPSPGPTQQCMWLTPPPVLPPLP